ncbi:Maf family protein [Gemmatimonas phototrophica]|uniref:dTTP/UTP pyrophosphatase n=1 Tax=Gemmatimonas phototrophica TaxID=1379270 RepID=A0A143BK00_9BACT|nr:Maf family protein [Gemmatimonas phototrophica]AMW05359.1 septum formation protein Maf [Gemmatimonas phototrophica]
MHTPASSPVRLILASQSPRRRELLNQIGLEHEVCPADIDETVWPDEAPVPHCERLAREKAHTLAVQFPDAVVVGSDTIVVVDGAILGKPSTAADAVNMLEQLSGREHTVYTAVAVAHGGQTLSGVEAVTVRFRVLSRPQIEAYVRTGEPMDKAGAYGIQGYGATMVEAITGDYYAVMGLPLGRLVELLQALGFVYRFAPLAS